MWTDGRTDREMEGHDEANNRFSRFFERAQKLTEERMNTFFGWSHCIK
jgi:hypothetical protein